MPKSLKDQLKDWREEKRELNEALRDVEKDTRRARVLAEEERRLAAEAAARAQDAGRSAGASAGEGAVDDDDDLGDEELFRRAVERMRSGSDAILQKYDKTDVPPSSLSTGPGGAPRKDVSDQALFLQAVGEMRREDVERMKPATTVEKKPADARFARRVQKGEVEPANVLDLHGDDRTRALQRTSVFLDAEARARTEVVLVVHGKGSGVLAGEVLRLLDEHPLVVEHVVAPRALGGDGARVVRLRAPTKKRRG